MELVVKPGKYIVAVSGGVDSVVLLDILSKLPQLNLVIAHFDHGIRTDSVRDNKFVEELARQYGLEFFAEAGQLGSKASEAMAREKRYAFLRKIKQRSAADAIVTAHHQDDIIETVIINLLRGTGRRGLSSLQSTDDIIRPLLHVPKSEILHYANEHHLKWREDNTNKDEKYFRNYIRHQIVPKLSTAKRDELLQIINKAGSSNQVIDKAVRQALMGQVTDSELSRSWFIGLPHTVAKEIMASWLLENHIELDKRRIEQLVLAAKTLPASKQRDIDNNHILKIGKDKLALVLRER
ncbi:MAG TPA: tRNA lysidine(34) synthetase TilS [Candidatus Saccharimonadales bacterium]|nr:tRNA lysidine(34) synthetase TilS [Candidatus Saccharimonadales bacterium]